MFLTASFAQTSTNASFIKLYPALVTGKQAFDRDNYFLLHWYISVNLICGCDYIALDISVNLFYYFFMMKMKCI